MQPKRPMFGSFLNVSDDGGDTTIGNDDTEDDGRSTCTEDLNGGKLASDEYFKPSIDAMTFAEVKNGEFVELSSVKDYKTVYIRSTTHDERMINLSSKINKTVSGQPELSMFVPLKKKDVILVKYLGDFARASVDDDERATLRLIDIGTAIKFEADDVRYISPDSFPKLKNRPLLNF